MRARKRAFIKVISFMDLPPRIYERIRLKVTLIVAAMDIFLAYSPVSFVFEICFSL